MPSTNKNNTRVSKKQSSSASAGTGRMTRQKSKLAAAAANEVGLLGAGDTKVASGKRGKKKQIKDSKKKTTGTGTTPVKDGSKTAGTSSAQAAGTPRQDRKRKRQDEEESQESQEYFDAQSQPTYEGKGKGRAVDVDDKPPKERHIFRMMDLPLELREEIYRACLTRPYKILLSKPEPTPNADKVKAEKKANKRRRLNRGGSGNDDGGPVYVSTAPHLVSVVTRPTRSNTRPTVLATSRRGVRMSFGLSSDESDIYQDGAATTLAVRNYAAPDDPLVINLLRVSRDIYEEARDVMYKENVFDLALPTGVHTLAGLHQRSRRLIKHVELEIPTYTEILERFSEIVRLSLRYCSGLKTLTIHTPFKLPGTDGNGGHVTNSIANNSTVYANGFDILRWLPQQCAVVLAGQRNGEIETVVAKHLSLAGTQDKVSYHYYQTYPGSMRMLGGD
ncbi:uncharacterized protein LTR77_001094 [Saxophila tyrrhenica]|uniref:Uncharacterized protein n=1 Tax=Saxophila tyrrhenica TaxID=1690608 RepID=A0AAV9PKH3_9PEZI|nr:hypothetical protein LTR77_001094 [Saxophila tyrrhenica]